MYDFIGEIDNLLNSHIDSNESVNINENFDFTSKIIESTDFLNFINKIEEELLLYQENQKKSLISSEDYILITSAQKYCENLSEDIFILTRAIKDIYNKKFPELQNIIPNLIDYVKVVHLLETSDCNLDSLKNTIPHHIILAINILLPNIINNNLERKIKNALINNCDKVFLCSKYNDLIQKFIETKMELIAPNVSVLVGKEIASKLIIAAGGIKNLSIMPSCNIQVLGSKKINLNGFSSANKMHRGIIAESIFVKSQPEEHQKKALRKLSGKVALAARCDFFRKDIKYVDNFDNQYEGSILCENNENRNENNSYYDNLELIENEIYNSNYFDNDLDLKSKFNENDFKQIDLESINYGEKFKKLIDQKINNVVNFIQPVYIKPLPKPLDEPRKKRGGKRLRKTKKNNEISEMIKLKNRLSFGVDAQIENDFTGEGYGMLNKENLNTRIRIDKKRNLKILNKNNNLRKNQLFNNLNNGKNKVNINLDSVISMNNINSNTNNNIIRPESGFMTLSKK